MFQFPGLSPAPYEFGCGRRGMTPAGFPRSDTPGSKAVCASPGLFAACRVLRRLPMPRHPPCAFGILAISVDHLLRLGGEGGPSPPQSILRMRSIVLHRDANRLLSSFAYASESSRWFSFVHAAARRRAARMQLSRCGAGRALRGPSPRSRMLGRRTYQVSP